MRFSHLSSARNQALWVCKLPLVFLFVASLAQGADKSPNVVVVLIDDMGWADFSSFGNTDAETPNVDRLAREGIAFEQFYVNSPICSPSRVAILTGTYPQRWRITSYLSHRAHNEERGLAQWLDPSAPSLARDLQQAGYATGHFGKWHIGGQRDVTDAPPITAYGFDESLTNFEGLGPKLLPLTLKPDGTEGRIWAKAEILGGPVEWMQRSEITTGYINAAKEFIREAETANKPFFINVWLDDVHSPFWPPTDQWGDGSKRDRYYGVLESMDEQLGALFDFLDENPERRENTLLLIFSDNGPEWGAGSAKPFRGLKCRLYEGGVRSPLIVWGPGLVNPKATGQRNTESTFCALDLAPSILEIAGIQGAAESSLDGEELSATLLGFADDSREAPIYFSRPPDFNQFGEGEDLPDLAVRSGNWKFLCEYDGSRPQLYDLSQDPSESNNLAKTHPEVVDRLTQKTLAWFADVTPD